MTASDRVRWFPYSYSTKKSDLIYMNQILNCQDEYGCGTKSTCEHDPKWKMFDFEQYFTKDSYDFLTMGCSVSYGTEIKKSETWRHNLNNTIDLSIPGIGIDGIWHNLKYLLSQNKIKFKKIIILLPDLRRRTFKIHKDKHLSLSYALKNLNSFSIVRKITLKDTDENPMVVFQKKEEAKQDRNGNRQDK